ncbi:hypothetical protein KJ951_04410 [Patescibacteria group bacterium]|nr:hypothetical protein [Patescibacteria group bacterium]MBU1703621.1 hypothetical protein [Patescibacteria group bacterium]MBU1953930.1 hypothetical protein [Patescibacteria group bacterium]
MAKSFYRKPALKDLSGASRVELETLVANLLENGCVTADVVNAELDNIRETTSERAKFALEVKLSAELLRKLEVQYPAMKAILERYEISMKGMPTWKQVKKGLTREVIEKALKLQEPALLLVPPTTLQSKVQAIDAHKVEGQNRDTYIFNLGINQFWNGGKSKTENKWRVSIVEVFKMLNRILKFMMVGERTTK